jgi:hypothetical protein
MADQKLLNKAITISAKEEKLQAGKPVVKLKDEKGLTYTVYKLKQDGTESIAWGQLSELVLGDTVQIGYVEDIKDSPEYGTVTYRTIRSFNKDIGEGMKNHQALNTPPQAEKPRGGANNASSVKSESFWEQQAYEKCCSLWGASLLQRLDKPNPELIVGHYIETGVFHRLFQAIKADGAKRFSPVSDEPVKTEPEVVPTLHADEDMDVEDIPF